MTLRKLFTAGLIGTAVLASTAQAEVRDIRIGVDVPYEPMEYRTPDGELTGFDIDLGNALCAEVGIQCEWVVQGWDGIIPGLMARKYDAIMSSMAITEERRQQVLFSEPYYSNPSVWVTLRDQQIDPDDRDSLEGLTVGVQRGTIRDRFITDTYGDIMEVRRYATAEDLALDVKTGRLDSAFMYYPLALANLQVDEADSEVVVSSELIREPKSYFGHGVAVAFRPRDKELAEQFNQALAEIKEDGTYDELMHKYVDYDIKI